MNHGVVMFRGEDESESRLWAMAMGCSQFVALYTENRMMQRAHGFASGLWSQAFVRTIAEPLRHLQVSDFAGAYAEYARFEPTYNRQILDMCRRCTGYSGSPTVVLLATASDEEAMLLLVALQSTERGAWTYLYERFYVVPRQNLRRRERGQFRLSHMMGSIHLNSQWAYFLGFFSSGDVVVVFLSDRESDVEGLFRATEESHTSKRQADWLYDHGVIEKW